MSLVVHKALCADGIRLDADGEPRWLDLDIATFGGMRRPRDVRQLIERNLPEMELHGVLEVCGTAPQTSGGRPGREYHLNFGQAIALVALMRTDKAMHVRYELIETYKRVLLAKYGPAPASGLRIEDNAFLQSQMRAWCGAAARSIGTTIGRVHGYLRREFLVPGVHLLPAASWTTAKETLEALTKRELPLSPRRRVRLRLIRGGADRRQLPLF